MHEASSLPGAFRSEVITGCIPEARGSAATILEFILITVMGREGSQGFHFQTVEIGIKSPRGRSKGYHCPSQGQHLKGGSPGLSYAHSSLLLRLWVKLPQDRQGSLNFSCPQPQFCPISDCTQRSPLPKPTNSGRTTALG